MKAKDKIFQELLDKLQRPKEWRISHPDLLTIEHKSGLELWCANTGWSYWLLGMYNPSIYRPHAMNFGFWRTIKLKKEVDKVIKIITIGRVEKQSKEILELLEDKSN